MNISAPLFDVSDVEDNEEMRAGVGRQMIWLHLRGTNTYHPLIILITHSAFFKNEIMLMSRMVLMRLRWWKKIRKSGTENFRIGWSNDLVASE